MKAHSHVDGPGVIVQAGEPGRPKCEPRSSAQGRPVCRDGKRSAVARATGSPGGTAGAQEALGCWVHLCPGVSVCQNLPDKHLVSFIVYHLHIVSAQEF